MMNIIQRVTDPMPTNLPYIALAKLLLLLLLCYYYNITAITITITVTTTAIIKTIILMCY